MEIVFFRIHMVTCCFRVARTQNKHIFISKFKHNSAFVLGGNSSEAKGSQAPLQDAAGVAVLGEAGQGRPFLQLLQDEAALRWLPQLGSFTSGVRRGPSAGDLGK